MLPKSNEINESQTIQFFIVELLEKIEPYYTMFLVFIGLLGNSLSFKIFSVAKSRFFFHILLKHFLKYYHGCYNITKKQTFLSDSPLFTE